MAGAAGAWWLPRTAARALAVCPPARAPGGRAQQPGGRVEQPGHAQELPGEYRVVFGGGLQGADVAAGDECRQGAWPGHRRDRQVGAGGQLPGEVHWRGGGPEESPGQILVAVGQAGAQRGRLQRGHRHALPVERVEGADRIPGDKEPGREPAQPLIPAPHVGREPVGADVIERVSVGDRGEHVRRGDAAGEGEEPLWVGGRATAAYPPQRQDPAAALLRDQEQGGRPRGFGADPDQLDLAERPGGQPQVPAGVHDVDPDRSLAGGSYPISVSHAGVRPARPVASATRSAASTSSARPPPGSTRIPVTRSRARVVARPAASHRSMITTLGRARTRRRTWPSRNGRPRCRPAPPGQPSRHSR